MIRINLTSDQIMALQALSKVSKMDCWFSIDESGLIRDLENGKRKLPTKKGILQLLDGATQNDFLNIGRQNRCILFNLILNIAKKQYG